MKTSHLAQEEFERIFTWCGKGYYFLIFLPKKVSREWWNRSPHAEFKCKYRRQCRVNRNIDYKYTNSFYRQGKGYSRKKQIVYFNQWKKNCMFGSIKKIACNKESLRIHKRTQKRYLIRKISLGRAYSPSVKWPLGMPVSHIGFKSQVYSQLQLLANVHSRRLQLTLQVVELLPPTWESMI